MSDSNSLYSTSLLNQVLHPPKPPKSTNLTHSTGHPIARVRPSGSSSSATDQKSTLTKATKSSANNSVGPKGWRTRALPLSSTDAPQAHTTYNSLHNAGSLVTQSSPLLHQYSGVLQAVNDDGNNDGLIDRKWRSHSNAEERYPLEHKGRLAVIDVHVYVYVCTNMYIHLDVGMISTLKLVV